MYLRDRAYRIIRSSLTLCSRHALSFEVFIIALSSLILDYTAIIRPRQSCSITLTSFIFGSHFFHGTPTSWTSTWPFGCRFEFIRVHTSSRLLLRATCTTTSFLTEPNVSTKALNLGTSPLLPQNLSQYDICPCLGGRFLPSNGRCFAYGRTQSLAKRTDTQFRSNPTYETGRESLVDDAIQRFLEHRVIIICAPPLSGKSTLFGFMGVKILKDHIEIEPVKIRWPEPSKEQTEKVPY